jgi:hypothetical protein
MANERRVSSDDYKNEPVMGYGERQLGVLGRPLPKEPDHFTTIMTMLSALPKIVPQTGPNMARAVAAQGRGGDTAIAHLTPGEMVIPRHLQTREVMAALKRAAGGSLARYHVGHPANRVNPRTGAPEFDDDGAAPDVDEVPADSYPDLPQFADQGLGEAGNAVSGMSSYNTSEGGGVVPIGVANRGVSHEPVPIGVAKPDETDHVFHYTNPLQGNPNILRTPTDDELKVMPDDLLLQRYNLMKTVGNYDYPAPFVGAALGFDVGLGPLKVPTTIVGGLLGAGLSHHIGAMQNAYGNEAIRRGLSLGD